MPSNYISFLLLPSHLHPLDLHSFPTRRSSDITRDGLHPIETAASTYSFSFSARTLLRTIRATPPHPSKLKTIIKLHIPVTLSKPIIMAFNTITNTMKDKVKTKSVKRISRLSIQPP